MGGSDPISLLVEWFNPFALLVVAVPVMFGVALWYQRQREKKVRAWAAQVGWTYVGRNSALVGRWRGEPFGVGSGRAASEVVTGTWAGRPATSFAYEYTTGSGKNRSTHYFHVVALALPTYLPTLELTPDGAGAKIAKAFGGQDLQLELDAFNERWRVEAHDPRFAHSVLHPRLMERLMAADTWGMRIRIEGTDILCWADGRPRLEAVARRLQVLNAVVDHVPRFVWLDHGHDPATP